MAIEADQAESPGWWFRRLFQQMTAYPPIQTATEGVVRRTRRQRLDLLWSYAINEPPLPRYNRIQQDDTRDFLKLTRANYALPVLEALLHRTRLDGVRTAMDQTSDGDDVARRIANASGFRAVSADAMLYEYAMGEGYLLVNPPDPATGRPDPTFTAEDPRGVITAQHPLMPTVTRAGLKVYTDLDRGEDVAHVFTPGRVDVARRARTGATLGGTFNERAWSWDEDASGAFPAGMESLVPLIKLSNRLGMGEYEPHLHVLDRIMEGIADRLWMFKLQVARQRAIIGDLDEEDDDGNEVDWDSVLSSDPGAVWRLPSNVQLWESGQLDATPILSAAKEDIRELASGTGTPMYAFNLSEVGGSAEGASLQKEAVTFRAEDRIARNTPQIAAAWRMAFLMAGEADRAAGFVQPMWAPVERHPLQARGAAAVAAKTSGMPWRSIMSDVWQADPETVARMESERDSDTMTALTQAVVTAARTPTFQQPGQPAEQPTQSQPAADQAATGGN